MRDRLAQRLLLAAALASALVAVAVTSVASGASAHSGRRAEAGSILVGFRTGVSAPAQADVLADADAKPTRSFASIHGALVSVAPGTTAETIETLNRDPRVAYAEPNFILHAADVMPNDPFFPRLWGLHNTGQTVNWTAGTPDADIDAPAAWSVSTGSPDVVVAVIDTGVDTTHPDLAQNVVGQRGRGLLWVPDERHRRRRQRLRRRLARMGLRERRQQPGGRQRARHARRGHCCRYRQQRLRRRRRDVELADHAPQVPRR